MLRNEKSLDDEKQGAIPSSQGSQDDLLKSPAFRHDTPKKGSEEDLWAALSDAGGLSDLEESDCPEDQPRFSRRTVLKKRADRDPEDVKASTIPWNRCRVCFCQRCGWSCGTLQHMTALGGFYIVGLSVISYWAGIVGYYTFLFNLFMGLWVFAAAVMESKGNMHYGHFMLMALQVYMVIYCILRVSNIHKFRDYAHRRNPPFPVNAGRIQGPGVGDDCYFYRVFIGHQPDFLTPDGTATSQPLAPSYFGHKTNDYKYGANGFLEWIFGSLSQGSWKGYYKTPGRTDREANEILRYVLIILIAYGWALCHLGYIIVIFLMRYMYREMKRYDNYWLLTRFPNLPKADKILRTLRKKYKLLPEDLHVMKKIQTEKYENLVLAGGGAKGLIELGALYVLEQAGVLQHIKRFCGTSVGSLIAMMLAANVSVEEVIKITIETDMGGVIPASYTTIWGFFGFCIPCRMWCRDAFPSATRKMALRLKYVMRKLTGDENITLSEFQAKFGTEFSACVTNITTGTTEFFTPRSHPDMPVYLALRASSAIPTVFKPVKWKGQLYVDGGVTANYPIWAFDGSDTPHMVNRFFPTMNERTIGINFSNGQYDVPSAMRIKTPKIPKRSSKQAKQAHLLQVDDDTSSQISTVSSSKIREMADKRVSIRVRGEDMIESYMGIKFDRAEGGPKHKDIAKRARPVSAPPQYQLDRNNDPNLGRYFGFNGLKGVFVNSAQAGFNALDRPKDIHRTILLNDPIVDGLQFDAARKPKLLLRTLRDGARSCVAFFKANYILRQKIAELRCKKKMGVSYYSPLKGEERGRPRKDLDILREDLVMTGVIPDTLHLLQKKVKHRLNDTGYLAYRLHVSLQDPQWLFPGTDPMQHMEKFMHFEIDNPLSLSRDGSFRPYMPEPFDKSSSPKLSASHGDSLSMSNSQHSTQGGSTPQEEPPMIELVETKQAPGSDE